MKKSLDQFTVAYPKWQSYDVWLLRYGVQQTEFFVILDYFLPFYLLKTQGKFFLKKKNNNNTRRCHFTHVYHKWKSYDAWFLRYGVQQTIFFFHFLPFYPTNNLKNKNFENFLEISFDMSGPQMTTTWYMAPVIWSMTDIILCHFGLFLSFYLPSPPCRYHHFTCLNQKLWACDVWFLRYCAQWTNGWTDRQTDRKSDIADTNRHKL